MLLVDALSRALAAADHGSIHATPPTSHRHHGQHHEHFPAGLAPSELARRTQPVPPGVLVSAHASEVLSDFERTWRGPLSEASLVAEVGASDDEIRAALRALGRLYQNAWDAEVQRRLLYRQFPACLVVALPGIGALDYVRGNYWTGVWQQARMSPNQGDQSTWGGAFREGLNRFRLARFHGVPQVNVGEIMMHAGIPQYSLADFLQLLLQRLDRDPSIDAASILAWATAPGHESRLGTLDKPVQRFLQYGGNYAEDIVD